MGHLHGDGNARHQNDLVAPIELIGLARRIAERHIGLGRRSPPLLRPSLGEPAHGIVTALIAQLPKLLEDPDQRQPFPRRLARIGRQELFKLALPRPDMRRRLGCCRVRPTSRRRRGHHEPELRRMRYCPRQHPDGNGSDRPSRPPLPHHEIRKRQRHLVAIRIAPQSAQSAVQPPSSISALPVIRPDASLAR